MTRDDVPGLLLTAVVGAGLLWNLSGTDALGGLVSTDRSVGPPVLIACLWAAAAVLAVVGTLAWWWGPIRVPTNRARWELSGGGDRGPVLHRALRVVAAAITAGGSLIALLIGVVTRGSTGPGLGGIADAVVTGAITAGVAVAGAVIAQLIRGRQAGARSPSRRSVCRELSPEQPPRAHRPRSVVWGQISAAFRRGGPPRWSVARLPLRVIAPEDGAAATARMVTITGDMDHIDTARRIRWCAEHVAGRTRRVARRSLLGSLVVADALRTARRPGDLVIWACVVTATVVLGLSASITTIGPAIAALLAYRAGGALASGLRTLTTTPALARAMPLPRHQILLAHSVLPTLGILVWSVIAAAMLPGIPATVWPIVVIGAVAAVIRRATRPELPWDAAVYITSQGGVAQPHLMFALMRGHIAIVLVAVAGCLCA